MKPTEIEKAIRNARMDLMLDHPFFGCIALRLKLSANENVTDTCATDGRSLFYSPAFMAKLGHTQLIGLLAHESMHIACQHTLRRDNRDQEAWNVACDYAINGILTKEGFTLPPDGCVNAAFDGMSAERIYPLITQEAQAPDESGDGEGEGGGDEGGGDEDEGEDKPSRASKQVPVKPKSGKTAQAESDERSAQDPVIPPKRVNAKIRHRAGAVLDAPDPKNDAADTQIATVEAAMMAQRQGRLSAGIRRILGSVIRQPVDWRTVLQEFITARVKEEHTWKRPNKRYADVYLPTRRNYALAEIVFAVDSSGSIDEKTLAQSIDAIQNAVDVCRPDKVHVIVCDAEVQSHDEFSAGEPITVDPCGGGGTDFRPVFDRIEREGIMPVGVVFFTDGAGYYPDEAPEYPVLWLLSSEYQVPWGNSLLIQEGY